MQPAAPAWKSNYVKLIAVVSPLPLKEHCRWASFIVDEFILRSPRPKGVGSNVEGLISVKLPRVA